MRSLPRTRRIGWNKDYQNDLRQDKYYTKKKFRKNECKFHIMIKVGYNLHYYFCW